DTELYSESDLDDALDQAEDEFDVEPDTDEDADVPSGSDGGLATATVDDLDRETLEAADASEALARLGAGGTWRTRASATVPDLRIDFDMPSGGSADPVRMYLKEIGKAKLLTAAEEVVLARCVTQGLGATARLMECEEESALITDRERIGRDERWRREGLVA